MALTFHADDHSYWLDGRRVPSVTQLLQQAGLSPDYGGVDPNVLLHARERGIHVEACCQLWSEGTLDEDSVHQEATPYLAAYKRWLVERRVTNTRWQVVGFDAVCEVAGTTDILCDVAGVASVVDVKAVFKLDRSYRIQLAAYRRMHDGPWRHRYILQLTKRGTYVEVDADEEEKRERVDDDRAWVACVTLAQWKAAT